MSVSGLHFTDGYAPKGSVVEFRNGQELANHCRLTNCVMRGRSLSRLRSRFGERGNHLVGHGDGILGSHGARSHRARADGQHRHGTHDHARDEGRSMLQPMFDRFENPCHNSLSGDFASPLRASGSFRLCSIP